MTHNNTKTGLFRPWDEVRCASDNMSLEDNDLDSSINYLRVDVKCERSGPEDDDGRTSPSASAESGSSNAEEEDSLHKLTSLVDRTILDLPSTDSASSCSETSFSAPSPVAEEPESPRSAFVPARMSHPYPFAGGNPYPVSRGLFQQEMLARQEHAAFDHFAAQHGQIALEEAARLLQHHEALVKQNKKLRPKKFRCPHCDVAFSNNGQLKGHIRIHTGERPFKCDEEGCGKTFTRNEELTRHKRIHSGVRPHACPACGKRFGRKDHLKKHARTHEMRGPAIYIPAPGPFPFPAAHPPLHPFLFRL